ncbi:MAG: chemotaxis protein CheD [Pseudomonadota bacterium]
MSAPSSLPDTSAPIKRRNILQGEAYASGDRQLELSTVLGSCVSTCLYDPKARIGGMNHFLLAEPLGHAPKAGYDSDYGLYLMEVLINEMLSLGASKRNLKGRLYGGANINAELAPIGSANAAFAREFLKREGIEQVFEDLEGRHARRIHFRPASGLVRCREVIDETPPREKPLGRPKSALGAVELF